jgi:hypothetical protein
MVITSGELDTPAKPPAWALLERELLARQTDACVEFFSHYFDASTGYLQAIPRWGGESTRTQLTCTRGPEVPTNLTGAMVCAGNDGPDAAAENGLNWTVLYALGAPEIILQLWKKGYEGHIKQYTEAKTIDVPMAREGMYYREFSVMFDWFHHTESLSAFTLSGLGEWCPPRSPGTQTTHLHQYQAGHRAWGVW